MPNLGSLDPQIVHFVVALRWITYTGKVPFAGPEFPTSQRLKDRLAQRGG